VFAEDPSNRQRPTGIVDVETSTRTKPNTMPYPFVVRSTRKLLQVEGSNPARIAGSVNVFTRGIELHPHPCDEGTVPSKTPLRNRLNSLSPALLIGPQSACRIVKVMAVGEM